METYRRSKSTRRKQPSIGSGTIKYFTPYWILTFIIALILIMFVAIIYIITPMTQNALPAISRTIFIIAELLVAYIAGKVTKSSPILTGALYGFGLAVILLFLGLITGSLGLFTVEFLLILFTGVLVGMLGSFVGKNYTFGKKRKTISFINK